ncbi:putative N-acetyltransferase YhbS [Dysgonomonas sp. PFB1-18]|uniref:GNAT family N-acetyltransferase n=1 Tax=unclassified Dysgonomonas TaxID=2630389 RepID=UPI002476B20D|nr:MULTISPECIES: GNAT family N-acetyltransferase [unclassified Dysgonomonas]MDH6310422.1 putative N-acetyltransferase YhbS [Dysgonomonas sp. PF1-14]MDH6340248.1 putative N-acetyltransferase YhbS [Dysgonomonas sp. PF1-16]MDH6381971.1 putative N-acetyltransferase YhbS [Dysgonomonas sp. PFB1-18]MDH6399220.1 putative N-acetyltransferase YhbS [Dysgonomonas sp. PF1-23]
MNNFEIKQIQHSEIDEVAVVLTDAFYTNPAYSAVFKDKSQLREGLLWLFRTSLLMNNRKQPLTMVVKEKSSSAIVGTYSLIPPQGVSNSISIYFQIGIPRFISKFGLSTLIRMLSLDAKNKKLLTESLENQEHHYLSMVVVKEEYRGCGIGSLMVRHAIDRLVASGSACHLLGLTTQLPENVVFYSRLGFDKLDEGYVTFKENRYYNCNMKLDLMKEGIG